MFMANTFQGSQPTWKSEKTWKEKEFQSETFGNLRKMLKIREKFREFDWPLEERKWPLLFFASCRNGFRHFDYSSGSISGNFVVEMLVTVLQ